MDTQPQQQQPAPLARHPLATEPEMAGEEFESLVESMADLGQLDPTVILDGMVLDGWSREQGRLRLALPPYHVPYDGPPDRVQAWLDARNVCRRHLSPDYRHRRRLERAKAMAAMRLRGDPPPSLRTIAGAFGVSLGTVQADLALAGVRPAGRDPDARPPPAPGAAPGEGGPAGATVPQEGPASAADSGGDPAEPDVLVDALGRRVPACLRAAFEDDALDRVARLLEQAVALLDVPRPWEKGSARAEVGTLPRALQVALAKVRGARPHAFHWDCRGRGCKGCGGAGYFTFKEHDAEG